MRVFYDTNVFISFLLLNKRDGARIIETLVRAALFRQIILLLPVDLLDELVVVTREKRYLAARITPEQIERLLGLLSAIAELLPRIEEPFPAGVRDAKDNYLLTYAVIGRADYLVTGDADLLVLDEAEGVKIVSPADFVWLLRGE
jgi:putative PIN family toxin of toxin-antitoxin system